MRASGSEPAGGELQEARAVGELEVADPVALTETVYTVYNGALVTWAIAGSGPLADWVRERIGWVLAPYRAADA